jgi:polysaccharide pyruvyl transferase CsaB
MVKHKIILSGYYGFSNAGDEAMLYSIIRSLNLAFDNPEITVISGHPELTSAAYGVKAIPRFDGWGILKGIWHSDTLISGGGSLLQDVTSGKSILYYLSIIFMGVFLRKHVFLYSQGIGPVRKRWIRYTLKMVLNHVDAITVRDKESKGFLTRLGVKAPLYQTADAVLSLPSGSLEEGKEILRLNNVPEGKRLIGISVRKWPDMAKWKRSFRQYIEKLLRDENNVVVFIPMQYPDDVCAARQIIHGENKRVFFLNQRYKVGELMSIIGNMDILVGMRLHALIFASLMHVPIEGISYDPKIDNFLDSINKEAVCHTSSFQGEKLYNETRSVLAKDKSTFDWSAIDTLRKRSEQTVELLKHILDKDRED